MHRFEVARINQHIPQCLDFKDYVCKVVLQVRNFNNFEILSKTKSRLLIPDILAMRMFVLSS